MATSGPRKVIYPVADLRPFEPSAELANDWINFQGSSLVLDNGATTLRAGWASELNPRLVTENVGSRYKERKANRTIMLAGGECYADNLSRGSVRSPFEGDLVVNFDIMVSPEHPAQPSQLSPGNRL